MIQIRNTFFEQEKQYFFLTFSSFFQEKIISRNFVLLPLNQ